MTTPLPQVLYIHIHIITSCVYFMYYTCPFCLVLVSSLLNITSFTSSKLRYLIFTESEILSLLSHSYVQVSLPCWTACTALLPCANLWPFLCIGLVLWTALKWFILPHPLYFLPYTGHYLSKYSLPHYLQFSINFFSFPLSLHIIAMYLPISSY